MRDVAITSNQLNDLNQRARLQQQKVVTVNTNSQSAAAHYQRGLLSYYKSEEARRLTSAQQLLLLDMNAQQISADTTLIKALGGRHRSQPPAHNYR